MKRCNKCNQEKDDNKFYTYYHSTQKKFRTRRICTDCTIEQKRQYRLKNNNLENNPDYKKCYLCKKFLHLTEFTKAHTNYCYECYNSRQREKSKIRMEEKGGSDRVLVLPDHYECDIQKNQVFMFMKLLDWKYKNGIWFKEGFKTSDGVWIKKGGYVPPVVEKVTEEYAIGPKMKRPSRTRFVLEKNKKDIIRLRKEGKFYNEISKIYNISETTIRKFYNECEEDETY